MRRALLHIVSLSCVATGCGELLPKPPHSKREVEEAPDVELWTPGAESWERWGTEGPRNSTPGDAGGHARCSLDDVRTDDLAGVVETDVPNGAWPEPVNDTTGRCGDDLETLSWRLMNCERIAAREEPLRCDLRLVWLGREHSQDMKERQYFDHVSPDGVTPFNRMAAREIEFSNAGENVALAPEMLVSHHAWMESRGHRDNILGSFEAVGVGVVADGSQYLITVPFISSP